jgi:sigma-B regulation protein RsbU (phosphoserine phosphatase)
VASGSWVLTLTVRQRIALVLIIAAALNVLLRYAIGSSRPEDHVAYSIFFILVGTLVFFGPVRALLWRVRNRLLLTYFLFGVVPIVLIGLLLSYSSKVVLGQYAADRVREALDHQIDAVHTAAQNITVAASHGNRTGVPAEALSALLNELRQQTPGLRAIVRTSDRVVTMPEDGEFRAIPEWSDAGFTGLLESGGHYFIGAHTRGDQPTAAAAVFAYLPLNEDTLAMLTGGVVWGSIVEEGTSVRVDLGKAKVFLKKGVVEVPLESARTIALPPARGFWDEPVSWLLPVRVRASSGKTHELMLALVSRPSLLVGRLFSSLGSFALPVAIITTFLVVALLLVEVASIIWSVRLTRTITRSVHDLYEATRQVARGNLSHRAPIRTNDQLSELAGSFNGMTDRITQLIAAVREKEKLESELAIARHVQLELFPKVVPKLETLELAGLCVPSRFVSGDYYDFVRLDDRWTALALGDISGKGIAAALVMASVQSALHAQLKFKGAIGAAASNDGIPSTATLVARLSEQIYENTPPEKYATFFCSVYDDQTGRLVYTNAGHLPPILIRDGRAIALDVSGMVIGLLPDFSYEQRVLELQSGDLLAAFTDGITEAENAAAEQFEATRLAALLIHNARKPLDEIIRSVIESVRDWAHDPESQDDITILLARKL